MSSRAALLLLLLLLPLCPRPRRAKGELARLWRMQQLDFFNLLPRLQHRACACGTARGPGNPTTRVIAVGADTDELFCSSTPGRTACWTFWAVTKCLCLATAEYEPPYPHRFATEEGPLGSYRGLEYGYGRWFNCSWLAVCHEHTWYSALDPVRAEHRRRPVLADFDLLDPALEET